MGFKAKRIAFNNFIVLFILFFIVTIFLYYQLVNSVILKEKDRINIAVFGNPPFVYSYNVHQDFSVVTFFRPDYLVKVPLGYDWYKIGSLDLLGKIEKQRPSILKAAFGELIGAPIDYVYFPQKARIIEYRSQNNNEAYYHLIQNELFSKNYKHSISNLFDRLLIRRIFKIRADHLLFIETDSLGVEKQERHYYYSDKLDTKLKGMYYHDSLINRAYKAIIITEAKRYNEAVLLLRQLEGIGVKVIEIEISPKLKNKQCLVSGSKKEQSALIKIRRLFNCQVSWQDSSIIRYTL